MKKPTIAKKLAALKVFHARGGKHVQVRIGNENHSTTLISLPRTYRGKAVVDWHGVPCQVDLDSLTLLGPTLITRESDDTISMRRRLDALNDHVMVKGDKRGVVAMSYYGEPSWSLYVEIVRLPRRADQLVGVTFCGVPCEVPVAALDTRSWTVLNPKAK